LNSFNLSNFLFSNERKINLLKRYYFFSTPNKRKKMSFSQLFFFLTFFLFYFLISKQNLKLLFIIEQVTFTMEFINLVRFTSVHRKHRMQRKGKTMSSISLIFDVDVCNDLITLSKFNDINNHISLFDNVCNNRQNFCIFMVMQRVRI